MEVSATETTKSVLDLPKEDLDAVRIIRNQIPGFTNLTLHFTAPFPPCVRFLQNDYISMLTRNLRQVGEVCSLFTGLAQ